MANSLQGAIDKVNEDLRSLKETLNGIKGVAEATSTSIVKILGSDPKKQSEVLKNIQLTNAELIKYQETIKSIVVIEKAVNENLDKRTRLQKQIESVAKNQTSATQTLTKEELKYSQAVERGVKAKERDAQKTLELSRAYNQLLEKQKQSKKVLQDLIVTQGRNSAETKKAQREYDLLTKKVQQVNSATNNFVKGGLTGVIGGFKNLLGAFGIVGGIQLIADLGRKIFQTVTTIEKLNFSLKAVTNGNAELIRTTNFLTEITDKYGASLITTTERYIKFLAAAKQSNVSMKDTEEIFSVVTKAAGVLGLKTDELSGIYLALEQMLSKGKVTTEELRRQLGERLPGAFGIMAKALGVTTAELDQMLKKGEVLSSEAIPKLAKELQNVEWLKNVDEIDTLIASQNRLENSWINLIKNIEDGNGAISNFFKNGIKFGAEFIKTLDNLSLASDGFIDFIGNLGRLTKGEYALVVAQAQVNKAKIDRTKLIKELIELTKQEDERNNVMHTQRTKNLRDINYLTNKQIEEKILAIRDEQKAEIDKATLIEKLLEKDKTLKLMDLEKMSLDELNKLYAKYTTERENENKKSIDYVNGSLAFLKNEIKLLEEKLEKQTTTKEQYDEITKQIEKAEQALSKYYRTMLGKPDEDTQGGFGLNQVGISPLITTEDAQKQLEDLTKKMGDELSKQFQQAKNSEAVEELIRKYQKLEQIKEIFGRVSATFSEMFDIDMTKFDFLFDRAKNTIEDWAEVSQEMISAVLNASMQRYEIELQEAQRVRDLTLNNDLATEEAKENARRKFEREERRIKTEAAKQERQNALIGIALDTAVGVAKAVANYASNPLTAPALGFIIPLIVGTGAAQAAIVASQPLPQFEKGTDNAPQGWAITQEKRPEPIVSKDGRLKTMGSKGGDALTYLEKGDRVFKSQDAFFDEFDIQRATMNMNAYSNGDILNSNVIDLSLLNEMGGLRKDIDKMGKRIEKMASRPINVNNKVEIKQDRAY